MTLRQKRRAQWIKGQKQQGRKTMWQIPFMSRSGRLYTVSIYGGGSGVVTLCGGSEPFVTEEDSGDDMFSPVRTQSGYIRIFDDGKDANGNSFNWKTLIPATDLSHRVELTHVENGTTVTDWTGYMQAQDFGSELYGNPQEREFPVQCCLSALSASMVDGTVRTLKNFAFAIKQAFDSLTGTSIGSYVFQGGEAARGWLMKKLDWQNMVSGGDEGVTGAYDNLQLLTGVCQFWGWSCRVCGNTVYFVCPDDSNVDGTLTLTPGQMSTLAGGGSAGTVTSGFLIASSISGEVFADRENNEYLVRGYSKATVESDANDAGEEVMKAFPSSVESEMTSGAYTREDYGNGYDALVSADKNSFDTSFLSGSSVSGSSSFNIMEIRKVGGRELVENVGTYSAIRIKKSYTGIALAQLETNFEHSLYDTSVLHGGFDVGGIYITGDVYRKGEKYVNSDEQGYGTTHIILRIGIGSSRSSALWFNENGTWLSTPGEIKVRVGSEKTEECLRVINTNHADMFGRLFVDIMGSDDIPEINGERRFDFMNFSVLFKRRTYMRGLYESSRSETREYTAKNTNKVDDEKDVYLEFASDNDMVFGYGVVLNADGTQMGKQTYGSTEEYAEQHLANRVASYWSQAKRKCEVNVRRELVTAFTPQHKVTLDGDTFYPTGISHSWRDDVMMLTLMQI